MPNTSIPLAEIEHLADLVANSDVTTLSVKVGEASVVIRRHLVMQQSPLQATALPSEFCMEAEQTQDPPQDNSGAWITAPMVGIFHPAKKPVAVGSEVTSGQVVGLIESMKLMNDVTADAEGRITDVLVENGQPVQYGQRLFRVAP
jgi:acetyl-CoA carboxylase biotin carboxyl carrier protein